MASRQASRTAESESLRRLMTWPMILVRCAEEESGWAAQVKARRRRESLRAEGLGSEETAS